jgi:hypothetical protein
MEGNTITKALSIVVGECLCYICYIYDKFMLCTKLSSHANIIVMSLH